MSSYPVLDNRPIDQWKVTELKEELKRRKLTTKGLKDDLIRRLDEALRAERENELDDGVDSDPQDEAEAKDSETMPIVSEGPVGHGTENDEKIDDARVQVDITKKSSAINEATVGGVETGVASDVGRVEEDPVAAPHNVEASVKITETVVTSSTITETVVTETVSPNSAEPGTTVTEEVVPPSTTEIKPSGTESLVEEKALTELNVEKSDIQDGDADGTLKMQVENEELKPPHEDAILDSAALSNQVSEVSPTLGNPVKSDSISTDSVSINEKNEFKDNIIADNIKLELDVTKPEMVEPSSSHVVLESGDSHPMDVEEPHGIKLAVKDENDGNAPNEDLNKNNETADVGYSEKLNLDRSSGDDSMDEDVPESKDADSGHRVEKIEIKEEKTDVTMVKEEITVDITGDVDEKDIKIEKNHSAGLAEKRKLQDQASTENNEPLKRQRKWKSENIKVPEPQNSTVTPTVTPGGSAQTTAFKRNFSRSDSTASDDAPKERVVPPSQNPPTNSLRIDRFLRPFTLKAVQELLGKTGTVRSFWMDHIKTHCYVSYSSVEEAIETRNAVYNLQWPPNGGRLLVADFVEPQEVKMRLEDPPQTSTPALAAPVDNAAPATQPTAKPQPSRQQMPKQQLPPPPPPAAAAPASHPPRERERLPLPPPPPVPEKGDSTIVTLDVLFRKTKATPRIYYLPLSDDQVAAKLAGRGRASRQ